MQFPRSEDCRAIPIFYGVECGIDDATSRRCCLSGPGVSQITIMIALLTERKRKNIDGVLKYASGDQWLEF